MSTSVSWDRSKTTQTGMAMIRIFQPQDLSILIVTLPQPELQSTITLTILFLTEKRYWYFPWNVETVITYLLTTTPRMYYFFNCLKHLFLGHKHMLLKQMNTVSQSTPDQPWMKQWWCLLHTASSGISPYYSATCTIISSYDRQYINEVSPLMYLSLICQVCFNGSTITGFYCMLKQVLALAQCLVAMRLTNPRSKRTLSA